MSADVIGTRRRPESPRGRGSDVKRTENVWTRPQKFSWRERARRAKERRRGEALAPHKTKTKRTKRAIRRRRIERKREIPKFWNPLPRGILGYSPELPTRKTQKVRTIHSTAGAFWRVGYLEVVPKESTTLFARYKTLGGPAVECIRSIRRLMP